MNIPTGATWTFHVHVAARGTNSPNYSAGYEIKGVIDNIGGATSFVANTNHTVLGEDNSDWDVVAQADDSNDALVIRVTGQASTNIRWVATVRTTEVKH
jgi:hypothetical protein